ncbi:carbohydrate porin [Neokomagataea tanensis]|uniref:Carbohydrate porin n=2 Tax=Neokomagataea TaxID=1223423 RepID=A0A4Y6V539_9PROT|nr:carbohydrate porin [Neokomagataea tanensis]QDH25043.1 carbohydrate porin [Neokomagataea tanensis]
MAFAAFGIANAKPQSTDGPSPATDTASDQSGSHTDDPLPSPGAAEALPKASAYERVIGNFPVSPSLFPIVNQRSGWLRRHGTIVQFDNLNEFMAAVTAPTPGHGYRQGSSNAGQYALNVLTDWDRLLGWSGFTTHAVVVGRYGTTANRMFGDWLAHSQETYGGGGNVVVHLVMAYGEQHLLEDRLAIAAGRMAQLSDFATGSLFCTFMNNSFCGRPKGASDSIYYSSYPSSVWAARVRFRPLRRDIYVQTGVYFAEEGIFSPARNRSGFHLSGAYHVGEIFPVEVGWQPNFRRRSGEVAFPGHYKLGFAVERVTRDENFLDSLGNPYSESGFSAARSNGSWSSWFLMDQRLWTSRKHTKTGLSLLAGAVLNSPKTALRDRQFYAGLILNGFWTSRPSDTIGLAFSYMHIANGVQKTEERLLMQNKPLPYRATGVQTDAEVIELNYGFPIGRAITMEPDIQYYHHPNGQRNLRDAVMLGFRSHVEIF